MKWNGWILALVIGAGLVLRTWQFESRLAFDFDNEFFAREAKKILVDKKLTLIGQEASTGGVFIGPLYTYISTLAYAVFNMDPLAGGVVAVAFGIAATLALYKLGGLLAAILYQLTMFGVGWDWGGSALNGMILLPVLWLYSWVKRMWWLHFLALGLVWHFHPTGIILAMASLILLLVHRAEVTGKDLRIGALIVLVCLSPLILFEFRHNFSMTRHVLFTPPSGGEKQQSIADLARIVLNSVGSVLPAGGLTALVAMGWTWWRNRHSRFWQGYFVLVGATFLALVVYPKHVTDYYSMVVNGPSLAALAIVLAGLKQPAVKILAAGLVAWLLVSNFLVWRSLFRHHNLQAKKQIVDWVIAHAAGRRFDVSGAFISLGYNTGYQYLFWWRDVSLDKQDPEIIYSLVIPPGYKDITPKYEAAGVGVIWDEIP